MNEKRESESERESKESKESKESFNPITSETDTHSLQKVKVSKNKTAMTSSPADVMHLVKLVENHAFDFDAFTANVHYIELSKANPDLFPLKVVEEMWRSHHALYAHLLQLTPSDFTLSFMFQYPSDDFLADDDEHARNYWTNAVSIIRDCFVAHFSDDVRVAYDRILDACKIAATLCVLHKPFKVLHNRDRVIVKNTIPFVVRACVIECVRVLNGWAPEQYTPEQYVADPWKCVQKEVDRHMKPVRDAAATMIQKNFRRWRVMMKYRYDPSNGLGKHVAMKAYLEMV